MKFFGKKDEARRKRRDVRERKGASICQIIKAGKKGEQRGAKYLGPGLVRGGPKSW